MYQLPDKKSHVTVRGYNLGKQKHKVWNSRICQGRSGWSRTQCPPPHTGSCQSCWAPQAQPGWSLQGQHQQSTHTIHGLIPAHWQCHLNLFYNLIIYFDVGAFFLQFAGNACDGPPRASSCHQHVHFTWWQKVSQRSRQEILGLGNDVCIPSHCSRISSAVVS